GFDGSTGRRNPPLIMGHEAVGEVAKLGANVTGLKAGDRVTFDSTVYCGKCAFCVRGDVNLCDDREVVGVAPNDIMANTRWPGVLARGVGLNAFSTDPSSGRLVPIYSAYMQKDWEKCMRRSHGKSY